MIIKCTFSSFFCCLNPKFDSGTWSIALAFAATVIFSALFSVTLSYTSPKCACPQVWEQLDVLTTEGKLIYVGLLLFFAAIVAASLVAIHGTFKAQQWKLCPFLLLMTLTEVATLILSVLLLTQLSKFEGYLMLDNDTYWKIIKLVMKEDLAEHLEGMTSIVFEVLKDILKIDVVETLNLDLIMTSALKDDVLVILGGVKRMMVLAVIFLLIGINAVFVTSILVVWSHFFRLRRGILRSYTGVPEMHISRAVLTDSVRSLATASEYLATTSQKSKRSRGSSIRSSRRLGNIDRIVYEDVISTEELTLG